MNSSGHSRSDRRGFTLTDLSVLLVALLLLAAAIPALRRNALEQLNRAKCADNLKQISFAMVTYANQNNGNLPRTLFDQDSTDLNEYSGPDTPNSFYKDGPKPNDTTASMFLLLKITQYPAAVFLCPSSDAIAYTDQVLDYSNFPSRQYMSYSMQNPFPSHSAMEKGYRWNLAVIPSGFPLFADLNPGGARAINGNSPNHGGDGQNVLYPDRSVEWQTTPFCGMPRVGESPGRDNIYTSHVKPPVAGGWPQDRLDSVMLPMGDGTAASAKSVAAAAAYPWLIAGGAIVMLLVIGIILLVVLLSRSRRPARWAAGAQTWSPPSGPGPTSPWDSDPAPQSLPNLPPVSQAPPASRFPAPLAPKPSARPASTGSRFGVPLPPSSGPGPSSPGAGPVPPAPVRRLGPRPPQQG